jgi:hypothetical protein
MARVTACCWHPCEHMVRVDRISPKLSADVIRFCVIILTGLKICAGVGISPVVLCSRQMASQLDSNRCRPAFGATWRRLGKLRFTSLFFNQRLQTITFMRVRHLHKKCVGLHHNDHPSHPAYTSQIFEITCCRRKRTAPSRQKNLLWTPD